MINNIHIKKLQNIPDIKSILRNISWLFGDRFLRIVINLIVGIWIARYLGPEKFGILNYSLAFVALFSPLATFVLSSVVVNEILSNKEKYRELLTASLALRLAGAGICYVLIIITMVFLGSKSWDSRWAILISGLTLFFQSFYVYDFWFQSKLQSKYSVLAQGIAFIIMSFLKVVLILYKAPVLCFIAATTCEFAISSLLLMIFSKHYNKEIIRLFPVDMSKANYLFKKSWPLILSGVGIIIYMKIDMVMLGIMKGNQATGIYSVAAKVSEMWFFIPEMIAASAFPVLVKYRSNSSIKYQKSIQDFFSFLIIIGLIFSVAVTLFSKPIILSFYGSAYINSASILSIHIWGSIFLFSRALLDKILIMEDLLKFALISNLLGGISNILLNLVLIPKYSGVGASISTIVSYVLITCVFPLIYPRTRHIGVQILKSLFVPFFIFKMCQNSSNGGEI